MNEMVPGLTGDKMSASEANSKIDVLDSLESIQEKLENAKCVAGNIESNGPLSFSKVIFWCLSFSGRSMKFGKQAFTEHSDLVKAFAAKRVSPQELKEGVAVGLDSLMAPVRAQFKPGSKLAKLAAEAYPSSPGGEAASSTKQVSSASTPAAPPAPAPKQKWQFYADKSVLPSARLACELSFTLSTTMSVSTIAAAPKGSYVQPGFPALISEDGITSICGASAIVSLALGGHPNPNASSWAEWLELNSQAIGDACTGAAPAGKALKDLEQALKDPALFGAASEGVQPVEVLLFTALLPGFGQCPTISSDFPTIQAWFDKMSSSSPALYTAVLAHAMGVPAAPPKPPQPPAPFHGNLVPMLRAVFAEALAKAFPGKKGGVFEPHVAKCTSGGKGPSRGEYQFNSAMGIYKVLKESGEGGFKAPRDVAQAVADCVPAHPAIDHMDVAPQGFVNVHLSKEWTGAQLSDIVLPKGICSGMTGPKRRCVVDFSSPNIAKEMHVGHLRSTIIGESICRFLEFAGHEVLRVNHTGDWGTQFGMLITHLMDQFPNFLGERPPIGDLQKFYKESKVRFDNEEEFKKRSHEAVVRLQAGAEKERLTGECCPEVAGWKLLCDISREEFKKIYDRLEVTLEEKGESFYNPMLAQTVTDLLKIGVAEEEVTERGTCVLCKLDGYEQPLMVRKSDGGYGYDSTDMAAIRYRVDVEKGDWLIYVTDAGQSSHFQLIFEAAKKAKWVDANKVRLDHIGFGVVLSPEGGKFKTRSGQTVRLVDLLDEAKVRSLKVITEKNAPAPAKDGKEGAPAEGMLSQADIEAAAPVMGYGAVKYADLANKLDKDYTFDFDAMLNFAGNTAVYLMYAYARIQSIFAKAGCTGEARKKLLASGTSPALAMPEEWELAVQLLHCGDVFEQVYLTLHPHHMCTFLYELAEKINQFCGSKKCRVLGSETQDQKLVLLHMCSETLKIGMSLVGLGVVERL